MAPVQFHWFQFLSHAFPITKFAGLVPALKRVAFDQLIFAPVGTFSNRDSRTGHLHEQRLTQHRPRMLFHIHDRRRGWWEACYHSEVSRRLRSRVEGQLYHLASGADAQFPGPAHSVPDRELSSAHRV